MSPKSPKNDPLGIRQQIRSILKTVIENHKKWELAVKRGVALCGTIENIKKQSLDRVVSEPSETLYPEDLKLPSEKLKTITTILKDVLDSGIESIRQLIALKKLQRDFEEKLLKTWTMERIIHSLEIIVQAYACEYDLKVTVMENMCHSSSKEELVIHATVWEFETFVNVEIRFLVLSINQECDFEDK